MVSSAAPRSGRIWVPTALLILTGFAAGAWFVSPLCYWQGLTFQAGGRLAGILPNWQPDLAPSYGAQLAIAVAWVVLWFMHARRTWQQGHGALHALLPAATFVFSAVVLSNSSMACGAY